MRSCVNVNMQISERQQVRLEKGFESKSDTVTVRLKFSDLKSNKFTK